MSEKYIEGELNSSGGLGHEGNLRMDRLGGRDSALEETTREVERLKMHQTNLRRQRPRSLRLHTPNGKIALIALIEKLATSNIKPRALARTPNKDLEITFHTVEDKHRFLRLPFVQLSSELREPSKRNPGKKK